MLSHAECRSIRYECGEVALKHTTRMRLAEHGVCVRCVGACVWDACGVSGAGH